MYGENKTRNKTTTTLVEKCKSKSSRMHKNLNKIKSIQIQRNRIPITHTTKSVLKLER